MDWTQIVETWGAIAAAAAGLWAVLRPFLPAICEAVRIYAQQVEDERRREIIEALVRAAEEIHIGRDMGEEKHNYVRREADARGYKLSDAEIHAAARKITKEQPLQEAILPRREPP